MVPNPYHLEMVRQGAEAWNQWRVDSQATSPELAGADLSDFNLSGYQFARVDLCEANLCRANLSDVDLSNANLSMAYLIEANLFRANLSEANLARANMAKANCFGVDFTKANMAEVNLSGASLPLANLTMANLTKANLSQANLLKACLHETLGLSEGNDDWKTPSSVPILTPALVRENNLITREMLRGDGGEKLLEPVPIQISLPGETSFQEETTLTNALIDVMKAFGFNLTGNLKVSRNSFCATLLYAVKGPKSPQKMEKSLLSLFEGLSGILAIRPSHSMVTNPQLRAMDCFIATIFSSKNQLRIQIDTLLIVQSYRQGEALIQVHHISGALRDKLANDPEMLNSPNLAEIIVEDQTTP